LRCARSIASVSLMNKTNRLPRPAVPVAIRLDMMRRAMGLSDAQFAEMTVVEFAKLRADFQTAKLVAALDKFNASALVGSRILTSNDTVQP
jgi:hypothetical protein